MRKRGGRPAVNEAEDGGGDSCLNEAVGKEREESNATASLAGETLAAV